MAAHGSAASVVPLEHYWGGRLVVVVVVRRRLCEGNGLEDVVVLHGRAEDVVEEAVKRFADGGEAVVVELVEPFDAIGGEASMGPSPEAVVDFADAYGVCEGNGLLK